MTLRGWITALSGVIALGSTSLAAPPTVQDPTLETTFGPNVRILRDTLSGALRAAYGLSVATTGATPEARARSFVAAWKKALGLATSDVVLVDVQALPGRGHVVRFQQAALSGVPVESRTLSVKLGLTGQVNSVTSDIVPFELVRPALTISAEAAKEAVQGHFAVALLGTPHEVVLVAAPHQARLAWRVPVAVIPLQAHFFVWVDAESGAILREAPAGHDGSMTHVPLKSGGK